MSNVSSGSISDAASWPIRRFELRVLGSRGNERIVAFVLTDVRFRMQDDASMKDTDFFLLHERGEVPPNGHVADLELLGKLLDACRPANCSVCIIAFNRSVRS